MSFSTDAARNLALEALVFVASRADLAQGLMAASGLAPDQLRKAAEEPDFGLYVLEFLLERDDMVLEFAADRGIRPDDVMAARTALAGPGSYGWDAD
ncbi:DUF3572 domain-containing protein [Paracoccus sp. (in: a-proteobacteria)]|uniref:DUF3572 domain-containing protein n=1 Tax=Paracoccus sp. TaxID=267 RepID=UPI003A884325